MWFYRELIRSNWQTYRTSHSEGLLGLLNMFSGGAFSNASIFALGIMPYISASIVIQLLGMAIPYFQKLQKEGESGRRKINQITRYLTVIISYLPVSWLILQTLFHNYLLKAFILSIRILPHHSVFLLGFLPLLFLLPVPCLSCGLVKGLLIKELEMVFHLSLWLVLLPGCLLPCSVNLFHVWSRKAVDLWSSLLKLQSYSGYSCHVFCWFREQEKYRFNMQNELLEINNMVEFVSIFL